MTRTTILLAAGILSATGSATAQAVPVVAPSVDDVEAGGYWTAGGAEGQYRLIVTSGGFEHVTSRLYLQWLSDPSSEEDTTVVLRTIELSDIDSAGWRLYDLRIRMNNGKWEATVDGQNPHTEPMAKTRWRISLGPPGTFQISRERPTPQ